jgi:hypothetical protein
MGERQAERKAKQAGNPVSILDAKAQAMSPKTTHDIAQSGQPMGSKTERALEFVQLMWLLIHCIKSLAERAPERRATSRPPLKMAKVGMLRMLC